MDKTAMGKKGGSGGRGREYNGCRCLTINYNQQLRQKVSNGLVVLSPAKSSMRNN